MWRVQPGSHPPNSWSSLTPLDQLVRTPLIRIFEAVQARVVASATDMRKQLAVLRQWS